MRLVVETFEKDRCAQKLPPPWLALADDQLLRLSKQSSEDSDLA